jgi:hypothetical protein
MTYTDVFGTDTLPPAEFGFSAFTFAASTTLVWPYNSSGGVSISKVMEATATTTGLSLTLPSAVEVSTGEDFLLRNVSAHTFTVKSEGGATVATLDPSSAKYFYLADNSTAAGPWGVLAYGAGASAVDAGALIGYGIKAISTSLNQSHPVVDSATVVMLDASYRSQVFNYTGGADTLALPTAATVGDDYFVLLRNSGSGTLTINPNGAETIDSVASIDIQPGESAMLICSGVAWFTVGLGRSLYYNFTQLVYDVSSGSPFTLTPAEASNKLLTFTGAPGAGVTVVVPATVAVYYVYSDLSTAYSVTVKTSGGSGSSVPQGQRAILFCDGTDVVSAQSAAVTSTVSLVDGSAVSPALNFASQTNTGIFKYGANGVGVAVNGALIGNFTPSGFFATNITTSAGPVATPNEALAFAIALG